MKRPSNTIRLNALLLGMLLLASCDDTFLETIQATTPPQPGDRGILRVSAVTANATTLRWQPATAKRKEAGPLSYAVYQSTLGDIGSAGQALANGILIMPWTPEVTSCPVERLRAGTVYYFNVLVRSGEGTPAAYAMVSIRTAGTGDITLFDGGKRTGELVDPRGTGSPREQVDGICSASPLASELDCDRVVAFISMGEDDGIADFPRRYGIPVDRRIQGPEEDVIAESWEALFNGDLLMTFGNAAVVEGEWWSGSDEAGRFTADAGCSGWTDGSHRSTGTAGAHNRKEPAWLSDRDRKCNNRLHLLCACWSN